MIGERIGVGDDFEGTYNKKWLKQKYEETGMFCYSWADALEAEFFTVKNNSDLLCVKISNGGSVILEARK